MILVNVVVFETNGQNNSYANSIQRHIDKLFPSKFKVKDITDKQGNSVIISEIGNSDIFFKMNGSLKNFTYKDLSYSYDLAKASALARRLISQLRAKELSNIEIGVDESTIKVIIHQDFTGTDIRKSIKIVAESINKLQENSSKKYHNFYISFRDSNSPKKGNDNIIEYSYSTTMKDPDYEFCYSEIYDFKEKLTESIVFNNISFIPIGNQYNSLMNRVFNEANIFLSRTSDPLIKGNNVMLGNEVKVSQDFKKLLLKILISPYSKPQTDAYIGYITCDYDIEMKQTDNFILRMNKK